MSLALPATQTLSSELRAWIREVGFPVVVAFYVLVRLDAHVTELSAAAVKQTVLLEEIVRALPPHVASRAPSVMVVTPGAVSPAKPVFSLSLSARNVPAFSAVAD